MAQLCDLGLAVSQPRPLAAVRVKANDHRCPRFLLRWPNTRKVDMAKQPRQHHYVPQFYLAGFTATGTVDGPLHVLDRELEKSWPSTPKGTAHARDYHAVNLGSGQDPMFVEKAMAICEGKWAAALKEVVERNALPQGDSLSDLLAFVAFLAVRVPRIRSEVADFVDRMSKAKLRATFATAEGRERFHATITQHCLSLPESERRKIELILRNDPDLKNLGDYANSDQYDVSYDQTWSVQTMLQMAITLLPVLGQRQWTLWPVAPDTPNLICSDSPVCLTWTQQFGDLYPPGFGLSNTLVTVPLSARLMLASTFEPMNGLTLDRAEVAQMNSRTAMYASQLFLPDADFVWITEYGSFGNQHDFLKGSGPHC